MIYFVGAGPGHSGLLTLRAKQCLEAADVVVYDQLVPQHHLLHAPQASHHRMDEFSGEHPDRWPGVCQWMIEQAQQGKVIVRLKGGDPSLFARTAQEAELLVQANVPFEIVPGVTAALGAAAYAGFPLTDRRYASAVAFVTGHEDPDKEASSLDWSALAQFPGALLFYMGVKRLRKIVEVLIQRGKPPETLSAVVEWASTGRQRTHQGALQSLPALCEQEQISSPALIVIGQVLELRPIVSWFEKKPLLGQRILVTRPAEQAQDFLQRLEHFGAIPYCQPTVAIQPPDDWSEVDRALAQLSDYQWLIFTSVNGVNYFFQRLRQTQRDLRAVGHLKFGAIGPATAEALKQYHLDADVLPPSFRSESFAEALKPLVSGQKVLLARADRGRPLLRRELEKVADVTQVTVYRQSDVEEILPEIHDLIRTGEMDYVTLTSSNVAKSLAKLLDEESHQRLRNGEVKLISISPVTSADVRALGWPVALEADVHTTEGILQALRSRLTAQES